MVVLTTGKTTTTGVLAVLADTALTGGNVAATVNRVSPSQVLHISIYWCFSPPPSTGRSMANLSALVDVGERDSERTACGSSTNG